jgi:hypothetical protein
MTPQLSTPRRLPWRGLGVTALFAILTVLFTWPLLPQIDRAMVGWQGDNYLYVWMIGWFQRALFELHASPLAVSILNYPQGYNLAYTDIPFTMVALALPFSPALGYNLSIFASFVLSGIGVYLWVRRLTGSAAAGAIAGTLFAFAPYRLSQLMGHLNLLGTQWFPFYFLGLSEMIEAPGRFWKGIALAAVSLGLIGWTSQYYLYMTLLLTAVYVAGYAVFARKEERQPSAWKRLGPFAAISVLLVLPSMLPYLALASQDPLVHTLQEVRVWSASPTDFLLPSPQHAIWGQWIASHFDRSLAVENTLYPGAVGLVLSALALVKYRSAMSHRSTIIKVLALTTLAAFVLALGTDLHWLGQPVEVAVPEFLQRWYPHAVTMLPLPGYLLFRFLPFYASMRVWMRYGIFVSLFISVLAGAGVAGLLRQLGPRRLAGAVPVILFLLVLLDLYPATQPLTPVDVRPVDAWLATQGSGAVAQFPYWEIKNSRLAYATLVDNKPLIGDPFGTFDTPQARRIQPALNSFPDVASVALLRELGVRWVIVDSTQYRDWGTTRAAIEALGLHFETALDGQYVYQLGGEW